MTGLASLNGHMRIRGSKSEFLSEGLIFIILVDPSLVIITIFSDCLIYARVKRRRFIKNKCIFAVWITWPHRNTRVPNIILVDSSLVFITLSDNRLGVGKKIYTEIYFSLHDLAQEPRGHEIYNFGRPLLGHHNYVPSLSVLCLQVEKNFKEIILFHYMIYMATPKHKKTRALGS